MTKLSTFSFLLSCTGSLVACGGGSAKAVQPAEPAVVASSDCSTYKADDGVEKWMTWESGIDLAGMTEAGLQTPNVIVHVAKMVHTPVGSAPSGMIFYQPDPKAPPAVIGFVSSDMNVAGYFGPNIFAGTPFEKAPALAGTIAVTSSASAVTSRTEVGGHVFEVEMVQPAIAAVIDRSPSPMTPFTQKGTEAGVVSASLKVDGQPVQLTVPPVGIAGGPGATWAPCGLYSR